MCSRQDQPPPFEVFQSCSLSLLRKLLESEETRCRLTLGEKVATKVVRSSVQSSGRSTHHVLEDVDEEDLADVELASTSSHGAAEYGVKTSSSGPIEFVGCDGAGQFVTIKNTSDSVRQGTGRS